MLRFFVRVTGFVAVAAAFALLVIDGTRSIAEGALNLTRLGQTLAALFPAQFPQLQSFATRGSGSIGWWGPLFAAILRAPAWLVIGFCGFLLLALARKPAPKIGYSNR